MTAEVCVMNTLGVALAADSAITIGAGRSQKIINTGEKLFQVSLDQPIGALIYGSAVFLGTPWETILKWFRNAEQSEPYDLVEECVSDFLELLKDRVGSDTRLLEDDVVYYTTRSCLRGMHESTQAKASELAEAGSSPKDALRPLQAHMRRHLKISLEATKKGHRRLKGMPRRAVDMIKRRYSKQMAEACDDALKDLKLTRGIRSGISDLVAERLVRETSDSPMTGVAFAGFGDLEMHPTLIEVHVCGAILGRPRAWVHDTTKVGVTAPHTKCAIVPFAQRDGTTLFVGGIDARLLRFVGAKVEELMEGMANAVASAAASAAGIPEDPLRRAMSRQVPKLVKDFRSAFSEFQDANLSQPMLAILSVLPKGELGELAETLINITSYRRRVSHEDETVGGPTDVAVITKGDGMIWVRRKHYFDADANPRYAARIREEHRYE